MAIDQADPAPPSVQQGLDANELAEGSSWRRFTRSNLGLIITPFGLALVGLLTFWYNESTDKIIQDTTALDWHDKVRPQIFEMISITWKSTLLVLLIAIPLGIMLTRPDYRRYSGPILAVATSAQAMPSYGLIVLFFVWLGRGETTAVLALTSFAILPVLRNTIVGLEQVDPAVVEAGRGMGLTERQVLTRIELPLAVPVILAGARTALVINVGFATLAFLIGGGGLGNTINAGIALNRDVVLYTGTLITAILALTVDWVGAIAEKVLRPKGL